MHIGILGGSFNPAHFGHRYISLIALRKMGLDQIWWIVTPHNPHKNKSDLIHLDTRLAKAKMIANHHKIKIKSLENKTTPNYSYYLIKNLLKKHPDHNFVWLMGADNLYNFDKWHRWNDIANKIAIIIYPRDNLTLKALHGKFAVKYRKNFISNINMIRYSEKPCWSILPGKKQDISASKIRAQI